MAASETSIVRATQAEFIRSATQPEQFVRDGLPAIAFVGRSNVGKSSLLNRLLGQKKLARTSSTPGRTQTINYFLVDRRMYFVDLPGYGYARAPKREREKWAAFIDAYFAVADPRPLVVLLVDGKIGGTALDRQARDYFLGQGLETQVVATKIDKVPRGKRAKAIRAVRATLGIDDSVSIVAASAESGEGMSDIWKATTAHIERNVRRAIPASSTLETTSTD